MNSSGIDANETVAHRLSGPPRQTRLQHYGLAILSVGVALGVSLLLEYFHFRVPSALLLLFAVALSSWYGGQGPAVLAVALSTISFYWYFVEPVRTIYIYRSDIPLFIIFAAFTVILSWFGTVRRRGEADLREQAALLNLTHDTVFVMDMDGVIKYWNRAAEERYGWTADQAVGRVVHDLLKTVFPSSREEIKAEVTRAGRWEGELLQTRKNGMRLVTASRWSLERGKRGEPVAILETNNDVTERKHAEEARRRSEAYRAEAERINHTGSWAWNPATRQSLYWSEEMFRIFGLNAQEGVPSTETFLRRIHPEDLDRTYEVFTKAALGNTEYEHDHRIVLPDGTVKYIHAIGHPVLDENGQVAEYVGTAIDVTERKRAEEALRQSEAYLAEAQRISHTGSWAFDIAIDRYVYVSEEDYRIFGFDPQEGFPTREAIFKRIHPDDRNKWKEKFENSLREKTDSSDEYRIVLPDGTMKHIHTIRHLVLNGAGDVIKLVGTSVDITERKRTEEVLRQREAYLAESQRLTHTGSWALDAATREYSYWSDEMFRIFGVDPHGGIPIRETMGRRIHPEDATRATAGFEKSLREKVDTSDEYRFVLPDGTLKHIQSIRHPVLNDAGDVVQLVGTFVDTTERRAAEEALRESERRFRTFVDHAADAFFVLDFEQGTIFDVNRCACESLGYSREELIGKTPLAFDVNLDQSTLESIAHRAAAGQNVLFDRHWHRRKDGSLFPVEVHTSCYERSGRRFLLKVARDISDRLRAEEQRDKLRQLEADLAHINRVSMMGELTASIAHEVNQPLSGVVSNASACLRWLAGDGPNLEEAREAARRIVRDGKRAAEVVARVRAMTKRTESSREKLDLNETVQGVLALVGDEAKKNSVVIRTGFAGDVFPVLGDRVQLQQVVLNLVMNGIEAMSSVGEKARELAITTRNADSDQVQVTVQDSGKGLDPDIMPKIFEPFYTTKPSGMGMGLSISRSILQAHGGQLWAAANDGPGTTFHFTIPRYEEESHVAA